MTKIELSIDAVQELSEFILEEIVDRPLTWSRLSEQFLELRSIDNDDRYRWLFSRLIAKMLEEHWIAKTSEENLFEVGITFKGRTVLRHKDEIAAIFNRHFAGAIKKAAKASRASQKMHEDRVKKEQAAIKKSEKRARRRLESAEKRKNKIAKRSTPKMVKKTKIDLFGSGEKIRAQIPSKDNDQLLKLWKANTIGASNSSGAKRDQHLQIVSAIENEWGRRIRELPENEAFKWPSTDVGNGVGGGDFERREVSYLKLLGYTVGKTDGLPASARRLILDRCFSGQLPPFENATELNKWAAPNSAGRLRKIAYHIAGLAKTFKKMPSRGYDDAIADWEDDLRYMHEKYYVDFFHSFSWPCR
ncbi:hypothetical protein [Candidatus Halocynthiibacter alkanivorans]|uniref:hypothetical protein n=1 Tax=Candidatus Halocynthiibacter alkanivorans TaxID=2267619 RepID=UPI000DF3FAB1|nr:hypothetical protein [Candidatus Halocynthiibacter alkanivorans]